MARVGWVAARADDGAGAPQWLRLSVFDDGWVEVPTFGRAVSAVRGNLRTALLDLGGLVVGLALVWASMTLASRTDGAVSGILAGRLSGRAPGAPLWRRARTAVEFSSWLTHTTLIPAADISTVTVTPPAGDGAEQVVEVLLHSGVRGRYHSPDATLGELLTRFGVAVR